MKPSKTKQNRCINNGFEVYSSVMDDEDEVSDHEDIPGDILTGLVLTILSVSLLFICIAWL